MSKQQEEQDLQKFLSNVDEITSLIQGLGSTDPAVQERAITDTEARLAAAAVQDETLGKTKVDRTLINTKAPVLPNQEETMNPESFMAALEKDARERAKRRKENEILANALKAEGNDAFGKGDYVAAIQKYTEGLKKQKDMQVLYTNRAQAYMKLQEFEKAIRDCNWALRVGRLTSSLARSHLALPLEQNREAISLDECDEKCIKALFHMGKANLALKQYSKSKECYLKILDIDPQKEKLCKDCIKEVDLEEKQQVEEERAKEELESGRQSAITVNTLLEKLSKPDEKALYYAGGVQLLTDAVQDCVEQTLFRINDGFSVLNDNEVIRRVFGAVTKSPAEVELCLSLLFLWQAVCKGNEENQRLLLTHPDVNAQLPDLLLSEVPEIQEQCLALLSLYAQTENGRRLLARHLNLTKWLQILMSFTKLPDRRATDAMNLLTSLILEEKFKVQCRIKLSTEALPLFVQLLGSIKTVNHEAFAQCITIMGDLCSDQLFQMQMAESQECWQACLNLVAECWPESKFTTYPECLHAVLGLMMNLSLESNLVIQEFAEELTVKCMSLFHNKDGRIVTRAVGLLSHILPASSAAVEEAVKQKVVKTMIRFLKADGPASASAVMKTLAVCARSSRRAQEQMVKLDEKCHLLLKLLRSENEVVAGNAAFCLGRCLEVPGTATNLLDTDVVRILLKLAGGDAQKTSVQENASIALGKLCTADARHISRLRELNGMAILNSSMKHVTGL